MIEELRIRGLGVIDDALLELGPGLTVVTGETGAGKTMVVTALGLLLGGRADSGVVRTGSERALVEGRLQVRPDSPVVERSIEAGAELEEGVLLLARTVSAEGRSRAHVGGRSVPVGLLGTLGDDLVAVHGQSDQQHLLRPSAQRAALDQLAGEAVAKPLVRYRAAYERRLEAQDELATIQAQARERAQEADLLRYGLAEIAAVAPESGEDVILMAESERLGHAEDLRGAAEGAHRALLGDSEAGTDDLDAAGMVGTARQALGAVSQHDPELGALADRLAEVSYLLADVGADLASYAASVDADPARLSVVEDRRAALGGLTRKYGSTVDEVLAWARTSSERLSVLTSDTARSDELTAEISELTEALTQAAGDLTRARKKAGRKLGAEVTTELAALAMPDAEVSVSITSTDPGPYGCDGIEFVLTPHAGAPARAIARGASGGELSRVMLALEVVLAGSDPVPTFVFDEVDAGVGGRAAVEVGARLARLARTAQVLVVTHLPQVAAYADRHLLVEKSSDGSVTSSGVITLDEGGRVRELTRMLAGLADSVSGAEHARELLDAAAATKSG